MRGPHQGIDLTPTMRPMDQKQICMILALGDLGKSPPRGVHFPGSLKSLGCRSVPTIADPSKRLQWELRPPLCTCPFSNRCQCGQDRDETEGFEDVQLRRRHVKSPRCGESHDASASSGKSRRCLPKSGRSQGGNGGSLSTIGMVVRRTSGGFSSFVLTGFSCYKSLLI
jgi:hypothetical protein